MKDLIAYIEKMFNRLMESKFHLWIILIICITTVTIIGIQTVGVIYPNAQANAKNAETNARLTSTVNILATTLRSEMMHRDAEYEKLKKITQKRIEPLRLLHEKLGLPFNDEMVDLTDAEETKIEKEIKLKYDRYRIKPMYEEEGAE